MNLKRLIRTTAFRSALAYACLFSLLSALGLGAIYWATKNHIEEQIDARLRLESQVLLELYRSRSLPALLETIQRNEKDDNAFFFYRLWGPERGWLTTRPEQRLNISELAQRHYLTVQQGDDWLRVLATELPGGYRLLIGRDLNDERDLLEYTASATLIVIAVIFALAVMGSILMGRSVLRRIDAVSQTAGAIMAGDLGQRLPISARDNEFDLLSRKLNAMLERIEQLMSGMRQVTDNIAHDLRKPLNRLRSRLEVTLLEAREEDEYRAVMESTIADADELLKTFNALLSIAQAEAGVNYDEGRSVNLSELVEDAADLYGAVAEDKGIAFEYSAQADLIIQGNRHLLTQALANLLDNAIKYTPQGGRIELSAARESDSGLPVLRVADSGSGIPEAERERVLRRFVRLDSARSLPGSGLGLSLVNAVAKLHQAELRLQDNRPGLCVSLRFGGV